MNNSFNNPFKSLKEVNRLPNKQVKNDLQLTKQIQNYQVKNQPQYPNCNFNPGYMNYNNQINNIQQNYIPKNHQNISQKSIKNVNQHENNIISYQNNYNHKIPLKITTCN